MPIEKRKKMNGLGKRVRCWRVLWHTSGDYCAGGSARLQQALHLRIVKFALSHKTHLRH
jgi:hypothetical protein